MYEVACFERGGFKIHSSHEDNFKCEDYVERPKREEPPKNNVVVILSESGRDIPLYDAEIHDKADINSRIERASFEDCEFVQFGQFVFSIVDIACVGYIGD